RQRVHGGRGLGPARPDPPQARGTTRDRERLRAGHLVPLRRHALRPGRIRASPLRQGGHARGALVDEGAPRAMKVVITGASGLIGSALRPALTAEGYTLLRLVRGPAAGAESRLDPDRGRLA